MKQFLIAILCFFMLTSISSSRITMMIVGGGGAPAAGGDYCSSCDPGDPTDVLCEQFETYCTTDSGWTEVIDTGTIVENTAKDANFACTNLGSYSAEFVEDGSGVALTYAYYDHGSAISTWHIKFWVVFTAEDIDAAEVQRVAHLSHTSATQTGDDILFQLVMDGAQLTLGATVADTSIVYTNIALNTQYEIYILWTSSGLSLVEIDGVELARDATTPATDMQFFTLGRWASVSTAGYTMEVLGVVIDDDTEPTNCTE